ncbi:cilia- and flagella-associated protein 68 isoform X2 [Hyperolius riggenbachi]|uniref:cilia- and flagella-associated protein 68 isoform X2 n=1 Tax=Hyperolius riggenbachi TaxID=752182 RepID=UPI0035A28E36
MEMTSHGILSLGNSGKHSWSGRMAYYSSDVKADGHGEVWFDFGPDSKLRQYGWRCTTKEDSYSNKTLLGNWNQERFDLRKIEERKPLPSQYAHYFETSYSMDYNCKGNSSVRQAIKREPHVFPGHQPELGPPQYRSLQKSCYMMDYDHS